MIYGPRKNSGGQKNKLSIFGWQQYEQRDHWEDKNLSNANEKIMTIETLVLNLLLSIHLNIQGVSKGSLQNFRGNRAHHKD